MSVYIDKHASKANLYVLRRNKFDILTHFCLVATALTIFCDDIFRGAKHGARRKIYLLCDWPFYTFRLASIFSPF